MAGMAILALAVVALFALLVAPRVEEEDEVEDGGVAPLLPRGKSSVHTGARTS